MATALPGCGEQAVAKVLSVAAGVVVAAASVLPGLGPFAAVPPAAAATAAPAAAQLGASFAPAGSSSGPVALKTLLGNGVPADWAPHRPRTDAHPAAVPDPPGTGQGTGVTPPNPLRGAATAAKTGERPTLTRPVRGESASGPLRSVLPAGNGPVERPARPVHPLRALLADPTPRPTDVFPPDPQPAAPLPSAPLAPAPLPPAPEPPAPSPVPAAPIRDTVEPAKDAALATFADHDPALVRRRDR
jgi:hypothetical protein